MSTRPHTGQASRIGLQFAPPTRTTARPQRVHTTHGLCCYACDDGMVLHVTTNVCNTTACLYIHPIHTRTVVAAQNGNNSLQDVAAAVQQHVKAIALAVSCFWEAHRQWLHHRYSMGVYKHKLQHDLSHLVHMLMPNITALPRFWEQVRCSLHS